VPNSLELLRDSTWQPYDGQWSLMEQPDGRMAPSIEPGVAMPDPPWRVLNSDGMPSWWSEGAPAHLDFMVADLSSLSPSDRDTKLAEYGADGWLYVLMTGSSDWSSVKMQRERPAPPETGSPESAFDRDGLERER
jgi:hypothetical protein